MLFRGLTLLTPFYYKYLVDNIFGSGLGASDKLEMLAYLMVAYMLTIGLRFLTQRVQMVTTFHFGNEIIKNLRVEIFSHLQKQPLKYFDKHPVGRLMTRVTSDVGTVNGLITAGVITVFGDIFLLAFAFGYMAYLNMWMALLAMAPLPILVMMTFYFRIHARKSYREIRQKIARINAFMQESISGMRILQIFNCEKRNLDKFQKLSDDYLKTGLDSVHYVSMFYPTIEWTASIDMCILLIFGGYFVSQGAITVGTVIAFILYIGHFFQPIRELSDKYNLFQQAMAACERIFTVLDTQPAIVNPAQPVAVENPRGHIELKNVWFAYDKEKYVLKDVSFEAKPGESIALVGATGAGKSSIINILSRFYDIQKGQILIDGVEVRDWDLPALRRLFGVVLQDVFLFTGTIEDNIRLGEKNITSEQVRQAAEHVNAMNFIKKLPGEFQHQVSERGGTFSTGEKQLLAFARALAFNPRILVLDEATSSIDTETELLIQDALAKLMKGRTSIIVAHRLSTIQHVDKIIVLHKGEIVETGNHQELLAQKGVYYKLYQLQYQGQSQERF
jgi:ABC-type multidrug transport system fused ATPase/permease subunit